MQRLGQARQSRGGPQGLPVASRELNEAGHGLGPPHQILYLSLLTSVSKGLFISLLCCRIFGTSCEAD